MSTITYKCPNCDADLTYRPATGDFGCEYCGSSYTGEQLNELIKNQKIIDEQKESEGTAFDEHAVVYTCPNCGAEVITDDTTAATFCFYCHNPVILKGRLSGGMAPDKVIPFSIPKEKVKEQLISWCKSKKYIDDGFFSEMQLEKLTGVYFPFWLVDSDVRATMTAKSNSLKVWVVGDIEYTETSVYALTRSGDVKLGEITVKALDRKDAELLNGVYPYDMSGLKDFNMSFLSGFMAEKRNIEKNAAEPQANEIIRSAAEGQLEGTLSGYGTVTGQNMAVDEVKSDWKYALMPAWTMTYRYKGELYYFAMNGQTGKIAGRVPVSRKKTNRLMWTITAACLVIGALIGGLAI